MEFASEFLYPLLNIINFQGMFGVYPLLLNSMARELGHLMLSVHSPCSTNLSRADRYELALVHLGFFLILNN